MSLPIIIFNDLHENDYFGLKILKNGYNSGSQILSN
jgi:hypothetical protein